MAVTAKAYGNYLLNLASKKADFIADTVKAALLTNVYVPNQDTHTWFSDVNANQLSSSGTGYTAGGVALTSKTRSYDASSNTLTLDSDDVVFSSLTATAIRYLVFYHDTGLATTSPVMSYMDFGADQTPSAANLTVTLPTSGIVTFTVS